MAVRKTVITRLCIVVALLLWVFLVVYPSFPGHPTGDTLSQIAQVHNHCINNWKPALYAYLLAIGEHICEGGGVKLGYALQCGFFGMGFALIVLSLSKKTSWSLLLLLLLPIFGTKGCAITTVGNDAMAAACYVAFIGLIMCSRTIGNNPLRICILITAFLLLWYGLIMRHNAVFCVSVLLVWAYRSLSYSVKRTINLSFITIVWFYFLNFIILGICHVEKSYPLKSPFSDDIVNISILNGKWDDFCIEKQRESKSLLPAPHEVAELSADVCNFFPSGLSPYGHIKDAEQRRIDYEQYESAWFRVVSDNPVEYLTIKAFFFQQFLMAGRSLPFANAYIKWKYPHVRILHDGLFDDWRQWCGYYFAINAFIPMLSYIVLLFMMYRVVLRQEKFNSTVYDSLFILAANVMYMLTFTIFTLSATEERYYIVTSSLSLIGLALLILGLLEKRQKTKEYHYD